jgi:hypothetical protein
MHGNIFRRDAHELPFLIWLPICQGMRSVPSVAAWYLALPGMPQEGLCGCLHTVNPSLCWCTITICMVVPTCGGAAKFRTISRDLLSEMNPLPPGLGRPLCGPLTCVGVVVMSTLR